ncbi:transcriptional adapter ADA2-like [Rosa rugosa]|uniref:transcriptional adapter ADA2-like n=1 Tax=Rosa rugosa TaxID=74645 RepID=UPI002B4047B9|nr:transcriptional adapter ADA2-like [Rosa rugosa]
MGRSRAVAQSAAGDSNQSRGKRKRTASGAELAENGSTAQKGLAQELSEPKGAFYHCNYCQKDISGKIRIKCGVCPDFDLCIECFSVGVEVTPHKCNHPYRVMGLMFCFTSDGASGAGKKASNKLQIKDEPKVTKVEESQRSIGEKKLRSLVEEGPSVTELSGYNYKRQEFEIEYDNDAEQILADMEFLDTDTDRDRELKLRVLHVYGKRLDERKRRKDFILERNLLHPDPLEKNLSPEVREIYQRFKVFMRFHSNEDHKELLKSIIEEQQIVKRILDLQEARAAGCRTAAEASKYLEQKRKNESEESLQKIKENSQAGASGKVLQQISPRGAVRGSALLHPGIKDLPLTTQPIPNPLDDWDISGLAGANLLSETDKRLCCELRILPSHYLHMLQTISTEISSGNVKKKSDAHSLFKVEPSKVDRVYDMVIRKGLTLA